VSNLLFGVAAAFLPSLLGVSELTQQQQLGVVFVAAIGGASFINTFTQKNQTEILAAQVRALELALDTPRRLEAAARRHVDQPWSSSKQSRKLGLSQRCIGSARSWFE
jgi:hypothetical protein